jgi:hypothetical protein
MVGKSSINQENQIMISKTRSPSEWRGTDRTMIKMADEGCRLRICNNLKTQGK